MFMYVRVEEIPGDQAAGEEVCADPAVHHR